jgi:hypothetical protein
VDLNNIFCAKIQDIQSFVSRQRRATTNKMCKVKCESSPGIYNFTNIEIPPSLVNLLSDGLKTVPAVQQNSKTVVADIELELKKAARSQFNSLLGYYHPKISLGLSIGRNLFWGFGLARVVDLVFGFGFGFGFAPMPLALLWQSLGCGFSSCLGSG